ncbi:MAG: hypothetical protein ABSE45_13080 [Candidatus Acidiferrales bacterium]|jgi:hypothetical protein
MPDTTDIRATRNAILRNALMAAPIALCALFIALYAGDYAALRYRMARGSPNSVLSTVTILYAAPIRGDKLSVFTDQPDKQTCVRSIFPQLSYMPCWYLRRHAFRVVG